MITFIAKKVKISRYGINSRHKGKAEPRKRRCSIAYKE
jgi:hypothetical protein